ncbi:Equilibrative nucleoside transporter 3 [Vanrija pseudolonga]|uniref:Equilibrative nucleoside transporter 3 n=1 Tax=Vanrija pseudolonga TaxID=143232 RepID=A0AAF0YBQ9_9TREE|nr:Equilibrative nucleoside transporter 3 [Vanrija pseudolonga]
MLSKLRELISPPPRPNDGYAPVSTGADAEDDDAGLSASIDQLLATDDKHSRTIYWAFAALGAGVLLSWNALICTYPFLTALFPPGSTRNNLPSYIGTIYCSANLFFLGLAQRNVASSPPEPRLRWSLLLMLGTTLLLAFPILPLVLPALSAANSLLLFPLILVITLILSVACSYLQSAVFALSALWGSGEIFAVMSGQGAIAVIVSAVQFVLAVASSGRDTDGSHSTLAAVGLWGLGALGTLGCLYALRVLVLHPAYASVLAPLAHRRQEGTASGTKGNQVMWRVFRKNTRIEFAVAFVFIVTLVRFGDHANLTQLTPQAIFPPITTTILSASDSPRALSPSVFISLHFLIFNLADYAGRTFIPSLPFASNLATPTIVGLSVSRVIFFPLFLLCNTPGRAAAHKSVFPDSVYFIILFAFGLTNGAISTICMITASSPQLNPAITDDEKDLAGTLAGFSLVSGLFIGSLCSFGVNYIINGNPFGG